MLIINKEAVNQIKQGILSPRSRPKSVEDVKRMLGIKQALLWRADAGTCCARGGPDLSVLLAREVSLLENALNALENGDDAQAISWLDDYSLLLERDYGGCYPDYCQP